MGERTKKAAQMKTFFLLSGCTSSGKTEILPHTQPLFICEMGRLIIPGLYAMSFPHRRFKIGECFYLKTIHQSASHPSDKIPEGINLEGGWILCTVSWLCCSGSVAAQYLMEGALSRRTIFTSQHPGISKKGSEGWHPNIPFFFFF